MFSITWRGEDMGAMWGVSVQPALQVRGQSAAKWQASRIALTDAAERRAVLLLDAAPLQSQAPSRRAAAAPLQIVAYGGEDGEVGVFRAEYEANSRRRISHAAVAGGSHGALRPAEPALLPKGGGEAACLAGAVWQFDRLGALWPHA